MLVRETRFKVYCACSKESVCFILFFWICLFDILQRFYASVRKDYTGPVCGIQVLMNAGKLLMVFYIYFKANHWFNVRITKLKFQKCKIRIK